MEFQDVGIIDQIVIDLKTTGSFGEGWTVDEVGLMLRSNETISISTGSPVIVDILGTT